ncbi:ectonucleotide pyrophosphatase/phosphodiesterase [uncultured Tenacibaculum sp.]|uniref:alkaline phosphatase family protein n=1 Tax=uncultured Tenacibaculum sp. TaxID=174713 RepID=UPI00261CABCA|nr:ectonucleotide pyrophosphatase/phosphodiesterase [uncultured Tenacibaculum sp.]
MNNVKLFLFFCVVTAIVFSSCSTLKKATVFQNSKEATEKPYVILISLDGFRWDYVKRFSPPNLSKFIKNGVKANSLVPSFPSKTFPNHYTIATGMYPENHGLLGNSFYSHENDAFYSIRDREKVENGKFYGGTPIWVLANNSNMVTASYFFVGSEADIQGVKPTYYFPYKGSTPNIDRVNQVIDWLKMPSEKRPHLITMYFSDMDDTGHEFGPNNDEAIKGGLYPLDNVLGELFNKIKELNLPINIVIVSDHGMLEVKTDKFISIDEIKNDELFSVVNNGTIVNIHPKNPKKLEEIYTYLTSKKGPFKVYKTADAPHFEYVPKNKNWGPFQVVPNEGYYFTYRKKSKMSKEVYVTGQHGFNPEIKEMHGIFYANGPAFKKGYTTESVKNIHVYPLLCKILGLTPPKNVDGDIEKLKSVLKE